MQGWAVNLGMTISIDYLACQIPETTWFMGSLLKEDFAAAIHGLNMNEKFIISFL